MVKHYTLTLDGTVQALSSVLETGITDENERVVWLQPDSANTHVIYVGGANATLSTTNFGMRLEVPVTSIPQAPFSFGDLFQGVARMSQIKVLGTSTEKLHVLVLSDQ